MSKLPLILLIAFAWLGHAQTTTIEVPQGSGVFPTIGQINCLEELGSGRYCAATYECSGGVSGELWGDLANHDGRRAIGTDSPVARQRDCVITVDGKAAVRWLTGYSPGGRTGDLVGLTTSADALRPVQTVQGQTGEGGGKLLYWLLETHGDGVTLPELVESECGHIQQGHEEHTNCVSRLLVGVIGFLGIEDNPATRCLAQSLFERLDLVQIIKGGIYFVNLAEFSADFTHHLCFADVNDVLREHGIEYYDFDGFGSIRARLRE